MRTTETKTVQRNGVKIDGNWYYSEQLLPYIKKNVYARYDPTLKNVVYIYSDTDVFICNAYFFGKGAFGGGKEQYQNLKHMKKNIVQNAKSFKQPIEDLNANLWDESKLIEAKAEMLKRNKKPKEEQTKAKVIVPVRNEKIEAAAKKIKDSGIDLNKMEERCISMSMEYQITEDEKMKEMRELMYKLQGLDKIFAGENGVG